MTPPSQATDRPSFCAPGASGCPWLPRESPADPRKPARPAFGTRGEGRGPAPARAQGVGVPIAPRVAPSRAAQPRPAAHSIRNTMMLPSPHDSASLRGTVRVVSVSRLSAGSEDSSSRLLEPPPPSLVLRTDFTIVPLGGSNRGVMRARLLRNQRSHSKSTLRSPRSYTSPAENQEPDCRGADTRKAFHPACRPASLPRRRRNPAWGSPAGDALDLHK